MSLPPRLRRIFRFVSCAPVTVACLIAMIAAGGGLPARSAAQHGEDFKVTTVFLVRHAEKASEPAYDPPLLESGVARSKDLARILGEAGVRAIYTSQFLRTRETAAPLASRLGIPITVVTLKMDSSRQGEVSPASFGELAGRALERPGENSLIVGHSNTVPETIRALGGDVVPTIRSRDFDDLFIVTVYAKGRAKVEHLKY